MSNAPKRSKNNPTQSKCLVTLQAKILNSNHSPQVDFQRNNTIRLANAGHERVAILSSSEQDGE